jgi:amino acid adenylation domain-containing protein
MSTESNTPQIDYPKEKCAHQLFEEQAARAPDRVALVCGNLQLTYGELDSRANQLAHHLLALGVGPEVLVGVCVARSVQMVIGMLGILKAGGAYLPLDPDYPPERLAFILNDAQAPVLLSQECFVERLSNGKWKFIALDKEEAPITGLPAGPVCSQVKPYHLAYVIYTSGSTGLPKGVQISHGSLLNLVFWHQRTFDVTARDRATQIASPAFDAAVWELWPYLAAGASVYMPDEETRGVPELLRDWIVNQGITVSFLPTPPAEEIIALEWPAEAALRVLLTGGDKLQLFPPPNLPFTLVNNYGPTESTVVGSSGPVKPSDKKNGFPSIGRPIANTQIYILNEALQQVPIGTAGELHIGGAGLARGYLNRPNLMTEKFIPNPFSHEPGARLYKTGDVARYRPDGDIEFVGRMDHQVKIRGFRIELAEIEAVLAQHPDVQQVVVIAREDDVPRQKRLVAYVLSKPEQRAKPIELRAFLKAKLPEYMVPSVFVMLDAWPLTPNNKIDYAALPTTNTAMKMQREVFISPRNPLEERLAGIMGSLLGFQEISVNDNFFLLGGHSLLGAQVITRVRDTFGVELALHSLFDAPTIEALSAEIERLIVAKVGAMNEEEALRILK